MAIIYVRSTDGNNADNGSTWALAKATIAGAAAIAAAGDTIYVSQSHAESSASAITIALPGTLASPVRLLCANDSAAPPTALATTATVTSTGGAVSITGCAYIYGISFVSDGAVNVNTSGNTKQILSACVLRTTGAGSGGQVILGSSNNELTSTDVRNSNFRFANANNRVYSYGRVRIEGGGVVSGTTTPTSVFALPGDRTHGNLLVSGFDLSNFGSSVNLADTGGASAGRMTFRNCKLPASWNGSLVASGIIAPGQLYELHNCDSTDTNYRMWVEEYAGSTKQETTIKRTGGASNGTTGIAWKMVSAANAEYPTIMLESPEGSIWCDSTGSKTLTVEIVHDSQGAGSGSKFQDDEVWLEVMYLGTSGFPLGTWITDAKADVLATAANQADSSETWTTTGLTTPVKQALSVTFAVSEIGVIAWRVVVAKASKTLYVCPKATLT